MKDLKDYTRAELNGEIERRNFEYRKSTWKTCRNCGTPLEDQGDVAFDWRHVGNNSRHCNTERADPE